MTSADASPTWRHKSISEETSIARKELSTTITQAKTAASITAMEAITEVTITAVAAATEGISTTIVAAIEGKIRTVVNIETSTAQEMIVKMGQAAATRTRITVQTRGSRPGNTEMSSNSKEEQVTITTTEAVET